jgi:hypothetical protein
MIFNPRKTCDAAKCKHIATYGSHAFYGAHCINHATDDEVSLLTKRCVTCELPNIVSPTDGRCRDCNEHFNPRKRVKRTEDDMARRFKKAGWSFINDKAVCKHWGMLDRPDFTIELANTFLLVENDERQHKSKTYKCVRTCECPDRDEGVFECGCQQARMVDVGQALGKPQTWIHFNPHGYKPPAGQAQVGVDERFERLLLKMEAVRQQDAQGGGGSVGHDSGVHVLRRVRGRGASAGWA